MAGAKAPHKAKPSHTGRKYHRNYPGRPAHIPANLDSKYVSRAKRRGTYRKRKGIKKNVS